jgi:hypothetical protein
MTTRGDGFSWKRLGTNSLCSGFHPRCGRCPDEPRASGRDIRRGRRSARHRTTQVESGEVFQALEAGGAFASQRSGRNPGGWSALLLLDDIGLHIDGRRLEPSWRETSVAIGRFWRLSPWTMRCRSAVASARRPAREGAWLRKPRSDSAPHSPCSVGESGLDRGSGVEGPEHRNRSNGGAGQFGRDVLGDGRETRTLMCSISPARRSRTLSAMKASTSAIQQDGLWMADGCS